MKRVLNIIIAVILISLTLGLIGWAIFIGRQQQELQRDTTDLGYFSTPSGDTPATSGGTDGGFFGGIFDTDEPDTTTPEVVETLEPILRQLYNLPTAGYVKREANSIRFVDRATGHVFEKELPNGTATRIDQTTVPQVYNAVFMQDGNGVIRQYLNDSGGSISVYSDISTSTSQTMGLPVGLQSLIINVDGTQVAYIENTPKGSAVRSETIGGLEKETLMTSVLRDWNIGWSGNALLVTQKPSGAISGSSYLLKEGVRTLVLQQKMGLIAVMSPDNSQVIYSSIGQRNLPVLSIKDIESNQVTNLGTVGFADKCVWHPTQSKVFCALANEFPTATYPDAWYQGSVHFSDSLWEIDTETNIFKHILSPTNTGVTLDMSDLSISNEGDVIFFINNTNQTLWSITIPEEVADAQ